VALPPLPLHCTPRPYDIAVKDFLDRISNGNDKRQTLNLLHATWAADIHHDIAIHKITASDCI